MLQQRSRDCRAEHERSPCSLRLRLGQGSRAALEGMPNRERAGVEVDVMPPKRQELTLPEAGADRRDIQRAEPIIGDAIEEGPRLVGR